MFNPAMCKAPKKIMVECVLPSGRKLLVDERRYRTTYITRKENNEELEHIDLLTAKVKKVRVSYSTKEIW